MKILIIEDERSLAVNIIEYLHGEGFICEIASDYKTAHQKINLYTYDCILLDITLPDGSGISILQELKEKYKAEGVIIISAKNSLDDKTKGLDLGADDYLTKPFHLSELTSRIKSVIRRRKFEGSNLMILQELTLDLQAITVSVNNCEIPLTRKEYDLLLFLVSNRNRVVSKNAIAEHLSGDDADMFDNFDFIYSHMKNLKKKLLEAGCRDYIKTIYGIGYKFSTNEAT